MLRESRSLIDRHGIAWSFHVVVPERVERRRGERRSRQALVSALPSERRAGGDRRQRREWRSRLPSEYADGWLLAVSATGTRRRIAPVPPNWFAASDTMLELLTRFDPRAVAEASDDAMDALGEVEEESS